MNWNIVCTPKDCNGAGIRDPSKLNLDLGTKILWRVVSGKRAWWKEILHKKYMSSDRRRCADTIDQGKKGTTIWELCKKAANILHDQLYWIPGSGKKIKIWVDNIGPSSPANFKQKFTELKRWMAQGNINTLYDLSS